MSELFATPINQALAALIVSLGMIAAYLSGYLYRSREHIADLRESNQTVSGLVAIATGLISRLADEEAADDASEGEE